MLTLTAIVVLHLIVRDCDSGALLYEATRAMPSYANSIETCRKTGMEKAEVSPQNTARPTLTRRQTSIASGGAGRHLVILPERLRSLVMGNGVQTIWLGVAP